MLRSMRRIGTIFLMVLLHAPACLFGVSFADQDSSKKVYVHNIAGGYHHGFVLPHHRSIPYYTIDPINGIELYASKYFPEINPKRPPEIGVGYYHSNMGNLDIYGRAHGFFMGLGGDLFRNRSPVWLQQTFCFGISYNTAHFDLEENPSNRLIGSSFNAFVTYSLNVRAKVAENVVLYAGPSFNHMSNGNVRMPNFGLNQLTTKVGISYRIHPEETIYSIQDSDLQVYKKNRFLFMLSGGKRKISRNVNEEFIVASLAFDYSRRINPNQAWGAGIDLVADASEGRELYVTGYRIEEIIPWHGGIHISWERIWNRLSISLQPGYKILTPSEHKSYQYNRVAIRYRSEYNIVFGCAIKAHGIKADFIEFGLGYAFER